MIGARGNEAVGERWITRSKLVDQLRDYQTRSHHKWVPLTFFSSNPHITSRADVVAALSSALLFLLLIIISSFVTHYFRYFRPSAIVVLLMILLPVCLKVCRQRKLAKKRERRLLLPLSL